MNLIELKKMKISELTNMAKEFNIDGASGMRKQELTFSLLQAHSERNGLIYGEGPGDPAGWFRFPPCP